MLQTFIKTIITNRCSSSGLINSVMRLLIRGEWGYLGNSGKTDFQVPKAREAFTIKDNLMIALVVMD